MLMLFWSRESVQATAILISNPSVATKKTLEPLTGSGLLKRSTASTTIQSTTANMASAFKSAASTSSLAKPKEYFPLAGRPARTLASSAKKREAESVTM